MMLDDAASLARLVRDIETLDPRMANATRRFLAENAIRDLLKGTA